MQNLLPHQYPRHLHAITWAGAHATHKAAQTYRDAVEGPSLRPRRTVLLISHTHIAPGKSTARTFCGHQALHVLYIGDTPHTGVDTHTPDLAIRYSSTTSSYAHYTTLRVKYTLVRYGFIAHTIGCATAVRLLPHRVYGWSSVQRLVDLKLPYDRLYPLLLCVARSWVAHLFYLRNTVLFIEISPPV